MNSLWLIGREILQRHMAEANVKKVAEKLCKEQACRIQYCLQGTERDDWAMNTVPMLT